VDVIDKERWTTLEPFLDEALELEDEDRARWLDELSARDVDLAAQLRTLLANDTDAERERFLERPVSATLEGTVLGAWTLERPIGYGGMGSVWLARRSDGRFEGKAAVKLLSLALVGSGGEARFKREGSVLARLTHPAIARLLDAGVATNGQPYLVLEHVEGHRIDKWARDRSLSTAERVKLFLRVLEAVGHAHMSLVVHRDLKPSNILVTPDGNVKLLDFGISSLLTDDTGVGDTTALTPEYAAPEQAVARQITTATDIYAAGVLLYVLLSGRHPTAEGCETQQQVLEALISVEPRSLGFGDLDAVLAKALHKEPLHRYPTAAAFAEDLTRWLNHQPVRALPQSWTYRTRKFVRRHSASVALGLVAILLAVSYMTTVLSDRTHLRTALGEATTNAQRAEQVTDFAVGMFEATENGQAYADSVSARALLTRANDRARELNGQPVVKAQMLDLIGRIRQQLGDYDGARASLEEALAIRRRVLGDMHADVATTMISLAEAIRAGEAHSIQSVPMLRHALAIRRQLFGADDPRSVDALYALVEGMHTAGDYKGAKPLMDEWMAAVGRLPERKTPDQAKRLHDIASVLLFSRRYVESEAMRRRAIAIDSAWYGGEHSRIAVDLGLLATTIEEEGRIAEAEVLHRRSIELLKRSYPAGDMHVANAMRDFGFLLINAERYTEAESVWRETAAMYLRTSGGTQGVSYASAMSQLGKALVGLQRYAEAEQVERRVLALELMKRPGPNPVLARARLYLGCAFAGQGKYTEAEPLLLAVQNAPRGMTYVLSDRRMATQALLRVQQAGAVGRHERETIPR
jgi:serine/threonine-protein kinase